MAEKSDRVTIKLPSLKEIDDVLCPECKKALRELLAAKVADEVIEKAIARK